MPKFLDYHHSLPLMSPDAVQGMISEIQGGVPEKAEVTQWNIFVGMTGQAWCLSEAPDAIAVVDAHDRVGFTQDPENVGEVSQLV